MGTSPDRQQGRPATHPPFFPLNHPSIKQVVVKRPAQASNTDQKHGLFHTVYPNKSTKTKPTASSSIPRKSARSDKHTTGWQHARPATMNQTMFLSPHANNRTKIFDPPTSTHQKTNKA
ncbi:unnamed protein product [Absidia cylindrospora]